MVKFRNNIIIGQLIDSNFTICIIAFIFTFFIAMTIYYRIYNYNFFNDPPFYFLFNPGYSLLMSTRTWDEYNLGANNIWGIQKLPLISIFVLGRKFFDLPTFTFLFNFMSLFLGFLGMFIFAKIFIFPNLNLRQKNTFSGISGLLFVFNPFTEITIIAGIFLLLPYLFIPWFVILGYKGISNNRYLIICSILYSFVLSSFFNPATIIISSFVSGILLFFYLMKDRLSYKIFIKKMLLFFSLVLLLTSFWNIPLILSYTNKSSSDLGLDREDFHSLNSGIFEVVRMTNEWEFHTIRNGFYMFAFSEIFRNYGDILYLFPIISLFSLIFIRRLNKDQNSLAILIFILLIIGLILAQGYYDGSPIKDLYKSMLKEGYFGFFRDNYKFDGIIAFSYSILISLSLMAVNNLENRLKNYLVYLIACLIAILLIFVSSPFWEGKLYNNYYDNIPRPISKISAELNNDSINGRVIILPASHMPAYNWVHPFIKKPIWYGSLELPIINRYGGDFSPNPITRKSLEEIYLDLLKYNPDDILSFLRVKKIIIDRTIDKKFFDDPLPTKNFNNIKNWLEKSDQIELEKDYRNVSVYSFNGNIYPLIFKENEEENKDNRKIKFSQYNESSQQFLNYTRLNPTSYKINVRSTTPFMIVFMETYDQGWKAKIESIDGKKINSNEISSTLLYSMVNGFWIERKGELEIIVEYEPQKWFNLGLYISIISLMSIIFYLLILSPRR